MRSLKNRLLFVMSAVLLVVLAAAISWHSVGAALVDQLQVETPGNRGYEEYRGMRAMSLWFGAFVGAALASILVVAAWWTVIRGRRWSGRPAGNRCHRAMSRI